MANEVKIYCGTSRNLPAGYGRFGTRYECMQCGYGSATMRYKWAPASNSPKPPNKARKGCYRSRKPKKKRSPRRRSKRRSPRRKSKRRSPKRRSPKRKSKRRSPKRKAKRRSPSRAQINKWILEELNRKRRSK